MPFQMIFGDDEHTAVDGPYKRLMSTRKWLYIGAAMALALGQGFYDDRAAHALLKVVQLPAYVLRYFVLGAEGYLLIQFVVLSAQLGSVYDLVLKERFLARKSDELTAARERVDEAEKAIEEYGTGRGSISLEELAGPQYDQGVRARRKVALDAQADIARQMLKFALSSQPGNRPLYRVTEIIVDAVRLLPPPVVAALALAHLWQMR